MSEVKVHVSVKDLLCIGTRSSQELFPNGILFRNCAGNL